MRVPTATYRVQLGPDVRFEDARALVPYLDALGVSDLYLSPIFQARAGSAHGYDVTDPCRLDRRLGSADDFDRLAAALSDRRMGLLLDVVPNHMAASPENPWWRDVLEYGPGSPYASFFDIDWNPPEGALRGKVLLPILGDHYGRTLERSELRLALEASGLVVRYHETALPLDPASYPLVLAGPASASDDAERAAPAAEPSPAWREIAVLLEALPGRGGDPAGAPERRHTAARVKERLWRLYSDDAAVRAFVDEAIRVVNGVPGEPASFGRLDRVLAAQAYALAYWRAAAEEVNYRRFFDIGDLVGLRVEDDGAFEATHALALRLVAEGKVTGLRIDHIDGLRDPLGYLRRLERRLGGRTYVVVEKVLSEDESLPDDWPVAGTTGYDFMSAASGVFVDPRGLELLDAAYVRFTGCADRFDEIVYDKKKQLVWELFAADLRALQRTLCVLARGDRHARDVAARDLGLALAEVAACMPVYRTYVRGPDPAPRDLQRIERAVAEARRRAPRLDAAALDFLERVLRLDLPPDAPAARREAWLDFVLRWQQFTGPLMAKGLEDTALYVYNRLISLNTVGSDPGGPDESIDSLHRFNLARGRRWPHALNATSTHDTKRSEDVRVRIHVLSEVPEAWTRRLVRWSRWNRPKKQRVGGRLVPDPNEEILIYQTLLGAWPLRESEVPTFRERLRTHLTKAAREAKVHTSWIRIDEAHEAALVGFAERILEPGDGNRFLADFLEFQAVIAYYGALNSLSELTLKVTAPGVPDFYQGTELWDFSLVDPDNRRPVDFVRRRALLDDLRRRESSGASPLARELLADWPDGRIKLFLTRRALAFRRAHAALFEEGEYLPLQPSGRRRRHVCTYARRWGEEWAVVIAPRWFRKLVQPGEPPLGEAVWRGTTVILPDEAPVRWRNIFTDAVVDAVRTRRRRVLRLPVALESTSVAILAGASPPPLADDGASTELSAKATRRPSDSRDSRRTG